MLLVMVIALALISPSFAYFGRSTYGSCAYGESCPTVETGETGGGMSVPLIGYNIKEELVNLSSGIFSITKSDCLINDISHGNYVLTNEKGKIFCVECDGKIELKDNLYVCKTCFWGTDDCKPPMWIYLGGALSIGLLVEYEVTKKKKETEEGEEN